MNTGSTNNICSACGRDNYFYDYSTGRTIQHKCIMTIQITEDRIREIVKEELSKTIKQGERND